MKKILTFIFVLFAINIFSHPKIAISNPDYSLKNETRADSLHGFDITKYILNITIDDANHFISGSVITHVVAQENLSSIEYNLVALDVDNVKVNNQNVDYTYSDNIINIPLNNINAGDEFTTIVTYSGNPVLTGGVYNLGMFFQSNAVFTISDPNAARNWWPCYDHPWDKAVVDLNITVRDDWNEASNGLRTGVDDNNDGTKTYHWVGQNPMTTFLVTVSASNFVELDDDFNDIPIMNFVNPAIENSALTDFSNLPFMMQVFSQKYGDYPFEKYGNVVEPISTFGGMEHQTMTTLASNIIDGNHGHETTIAHELAHQWFGDCLTPLTWKDVWLSESFATYSECVYTQQWQGFEAMNNYVQYSYHNYYKNWMGANGVRSIYNPPYDETFAPPVYEKGASVLHMLRLKVGDEVFWQILQTYFQTFHNGNVVTDDFKNIAEQVSGLDLEQFFQQWIFQPGLPSLKYAIFNDGDNNQFEIVSKTISNSDTDFYLDFPISLNTTTEQDSFLVQTNPDEWSSYQNSYTGGIISFDVDPHNWVFTIHNYNIKPEISYALATNNQVFISWAELPFAINGYNIYRSESMDGEYSKINDEIITETEYTDNSVENGNSYYYYICAVRNGSYLSEKSQIVNAEPVSFPMDQGFLFVDETLNGSGTPVSPNDQMVDDFYLSCFGVSDYSQWDVQEQGIPTINDIRNYSAVIWYDDDFTQHKINDAISSLESYILAGGKVLISGWKTAYSLDETFLSDFAGSGNVSLDNSPHFTEAISNEFPDVNVNPAKLISNWNGQLPMVATFNETENPIYSFQGEGDFVGQACGVDEFNNGECVLLGFPLYFMQNGDVEDFALYLKNKWNVGNGDNSVSANNNQIVIYPNPFQITRADGLNLKYFSQKIDNIKLEMFNIKGQKLNTRIFNVIKGENKLTINLKKKLSTGIYLMKISSKKICSIKKFVIVH
jgi:hypothetical protein